MMFEKGFDFSVQFDLLEFESSIADLFEVVE